jgi:Na+/H+ antiporter NhaC
MHLFKTITDSDTIYMYSFLFIIGVIIVLLNRTGAALAFAHSLTQKLNNARMAETASLLLSTTLFIDDYLNGLTVGFVMRPITDRFKIPRAKLAFLVHTMTGPLIILAPISSWVGAMVGSLDKAGILPINTPNTKIIADPFFVYLETIPYIFYSILMIASAWFIVRMRISFGPMKKHEIIAQTTGNLFGGKEPLPNKFECTPHTNGCVGDLLWPLVILIGSTLIGNLWAGGYYLFGGTHTMLEAFKHNTQTFMVLFVAACITLGFTLFKALMDKKVPARLVPRIFLDGIEMMMGAVIMVILALTLAIVLTNDLATGKYLALLVQDSLPMATLPVIFFIVATITATITGSAWGTMFILVPVAVQMLISLAQVIIPATPEMLIILFPVLGAIFSGAACGNHISPIADTTIMTSTSSGCYPIDHTQTQFPYALPVILSTALAYLLAGLLSSCSRSASLWIPLLVGTILSFGILFLLNTLSTQKRQS